MVLGPKMGFVAGKTKNDGKNVCFVCEMYLFTRYWYSRSKAADCIPYTLYLSFDVCSLIVYMMAFQFS
jgi:hypothetical protein